MDGCDSRTRGQLDALHKLGTAYLHLALWHTPKYESLPEADRRAFADLVAGGRLADALDGVKREALRVGVDCPDAWLAPQWAAMIQADGPLPDSTRVKALKVGSQIIDAEHAAILRMVAQRPADPAEERDRATGLLGTVADALERGEWGSPELRGVAGELLHGPARPDGTRPAGWLAERFTLATRQAQPETLTERHALRAALETLGKLVARKMPSERHAQAAATLRAAADALGGGTAGEEPQGPTGTAPGDGKAADATKRPTISDAEADAVARKLAEKSPGFVLGTAEEWAAAIERAAGKTCSATKVKKPLPFWAEEMERQGRTRAKARGKSRPGARSPAKAAGFSSAMERTQADRTAGTPLDALIAEEERAEAEKAVLRSGLGTKERTQTLELLRSGELLPERAIRIAEMYPPRPTQEAVT